MRIWVRTVIQALIFVLIPVCALAGAKSSGECDQKLGKKIFGKCAACHTFDNSGSHAAGPNLLGVVGRGIGKIEGFPFSPALSEQGTHWSEAALDKFLANPMKNFPGTTMAFAGIRKEHQRQAVICYLKGTSR
ncbi:c-type cytochrome [Pseudomaricurvus alkylphenolicus]|uniref:c-type cytochrome n=1 Tax=Pseudomaricurvus alkylphenolicus TaxID=1306991 RepID=UPI00142327BF|nr:c-type cytochrome [Pseudomaricurvus alkylphenolicus]NIB40418.1 c-type cytochrome [Pseudomaricurvus alkylphenolicus]